MIMSNQSQEQIVIRRVRDFGNADHEKTDRIYENLGINIDEHDTERLKSVCRTRSYNPTAEDLVFFDRLFHSARPVPSRICIKSLITEDTGCMETQKTVVKASKIVYGTKRESPVSFLELSMLPTKLIRNIGPNIKKEFDKVPTASVHEKNEHPAMPLFDSVCDSFELTGTGMVLDRVVQDTTFKGPELKPGHDLIFILPPEDPDPKAFYSLVSSICKKHADKYSRYLPSGQCGCEFVLDLASHASGLELYFEKIKDAIDYFFDSPGRGYYLSIPEKKTSKVTDALMASSCRVIRVGSFDTSGKIHILCDDGALDIPLIVLQELLAKAGYAANVGSTKGSIPSFEVSDSGIITYDHSDPFLNGLHAGITAALCESDSDISETVSLIPVSGTGKDEISVAYASYLGCFRGFSELVSEKYSIRFVPGLDRLTLCQVKEEKEPREMKDVRLYFCPVRMSVDGMPDFEDLRHMKKALSRCHVRKVIPALADPEKTALQLCGYEIETPDLKDEQTCGYFVFSEDEIPSPAIPVSYSVVTDPDVPESSSEDEQIETISQDTI